MNSLTRRLEKLEAGPARERAAMLAYVRERVGAMTPEERARLRLVSVVLPTRLQDVPAAVASWTREERLAVLVALLDRHFGGSHE